MKRVLVVHPRLKPHGGGQAVAAWTLQALREGFDLSLLTWKPVDYTGVNRIFGTSLKAGDFRVHLIPRAARRLVDLLPGSANLLHLSVLLRLCRKLDRARPYDVMIGTSDECDFGRRGIQYVHYPYAFPLPPPRARRWYHKPPGMIGLYRRLCSRIFSLSFDRVRGNLTLVNSRYIAERVRNVWGIDSLVLHPPVSGGFPHIPWEEREDGFVALGRIAPVKQLTDDVEIVRRLCARGHAIHLHLIGTPEDRDYEERLRALEAENRPWLRLHTNLPRRTLTELLSRHKYGLHAQVGEHFGIAVAECLRSGCIPFVARPGGPVEIIGNEADLVFASPEDAVERIERVLRNPELQKNLRAHLSHRKELFTSDRFMSEIRDIVAGFSG